MLLHRLCDFRRSKLSHCRFQKDYTIGAAPPSWKLGMAAPGQGCPKAPPATQNVSRKFLEGENKKRKLGGKILWMFMSKMLWNSPTSIFTSKMFRTTVKKWKGRRGGEKGGGCIVAVGDGRPCRWECRPGIRKEEPRRAMPVCRQRSQLNYWEQSMDMWFKMTKLETM